jgi:hypothetical protein
MIVGMLKSQPNIEKFNFHSHTHKYIAKGLRARGITVVEFGLNDPKIFGVLNELKNTNNSTIFWGHSPNVILNNGHRKISLAEFFEQPSVAMLGDHPFSDFKINMLRGMSNNVQLVGREPCFSSPLSCIKPDYSGYRFYDYLTKLHDIPSRINTYDEREIDLLVAMDFREKYPSLETLAAHCTKINLNSRIATDFYDMAVHDPALYPFDLFDKILVSLHGTNLQTIAIDHDNLFLSLMHLLHNLDMCVRGQRRIRLLNALDLNAMFGRIVILGSFFPGLPQGSNIQYTGHIKYGDYISLLGDSRLHLFANPTYPQMVNERVPASLDMGCAVICDSVPALAKFNSHDGVFTYEDNMKFPDIAHIAADNFDERIQHGQEKVAKYPRSLDILHQVFLSLNEPINKLEIQENSGHEQKQPGINKDIVTQTNPTMLFLQKIYGEPLNKKICIAEIGIDTGKTSLLIGKYLSGVGSLHLYDRKSKCQSVLELIQKNNIKNVDIFPNSEKLLDSYNWSLMKRNRSESPQRMLTSLLKSEEVVRRPLGDVLQ